MKPDRFFEKDAPGTGQPDAEQAAAIHKDALGTGTSGTGPRGGATDLFATIPSAATSEGEPVREAPTAPLPFATPTPESSPRQAPMPFVHEVVFKPGTSPPEKSDQFRQLLQPLQSPPQPIEAAPSAPMPFVAAPEASVGFTQLLRALNYDQIKPERAGPAVGNISTLAVPAPVEASQGTQAVVGRAAETLVQSALRSFAEVSPAITQAPRVTQEAVQMAPVVAEVPGASASFTQLFETLAANEPVASFVSPRLEVAPPAAPALASEGGSFTRIFQAVNIPAKAPATLETPATPSAASGSFTRMFQTLSDPVAAVAPVQLESFRVEAPGTAEPAPAQTFTPSPVAPREPLPTTPAAGAFTQMFRSLDRPEVQSASAAAPLVDASTALPDSPSPGPTTAMFSTAPAAVVEGVQAESLVKPAQAGPSPSFSQMLRSLDAQPTEPLRANPPAQMAAAATPGSFTQMFQPLDVQRAEPAPPVAPVIPSLAAQTPAGPGSFTQMFRSLNAEPPISPSTPTGQPEPGSFTQMFSAQSAPSGEVPRTNLPLAQAQGGSFTQLFGTLSNAPEQARLSQQQNAPQTFGDPRRAGSSFAPAADPGYASPPVPFPQSQPAAPAAGGLTQLLRTLDQSPQAAAKAAPEPFRPATPHQGAFTSTYGALDGAGQPQAQTAPQVFAQPAVSQDAAPDFRAPASPAPSSALPMSAGPSEFTRILNASAFRENALRNGGESAAPASAPAAQGGAGMSFATPKMPSVSVSPLAVPSGGGAPAAPHLNVQGLHPPPAPHIPPVKLEIPKATAPAVGKMQQLLPLLLIMIIFLLLAILIAVFFLMKR